MNLICISQEDFGTVNVVAVWDKKQSLVIEGRPGKREVFILQDYLSPKTLYQIKSAPYGDMISAASKALAKAQNTGGSVGPISEEQILRRSKQILSEAGLPVSPKWVTALKRAYSYTQEEQRALVTMEMVD